MYKLGKVVRSLIITGIIICGIHSSASSQTVTIGAATTVDQGLPIEPYYGYTYSQSIFNQSEIATSGDIDKIRYYCDGSSSYTDNPITVYIGHSTKSTFSGTTDWVSSASLTQVYTGSITTTATPGWIEIDITNFTYNNTDNLIIGIDENQSGYHGSGDDWYCTSTTGNKSLVYRSDGTNPDPAAPPTATYIKAYRPNIQLEFIATTPMSYVSSTTTQGNTSTTSQASTNQQIIGIEVVTTGSLSPFDLTQFQMNMNGSTDGTNDASGISIYYTGTSSSFATTTLFGSATPGGGTLNVNGSQTLAEGTNYFWIAYNIAAGATIDNFVDAECTQLTINGGVGTQIPSVTAPAGNRKIAVNYTFSTGVDMSIPDQAPEDCSIINVAGIGNISLADGMILDSVCLKIIHPYDGQLQIFLEAPDATRIELSTGNCWSGSNYGNGVVGDAGPYTCFDVESMDLMSDQASGDAPAAGTFYPEANMNLVNNGQNANGQWKLCIEDTWGAEAGTLEYWEIHFKEITPLPTCSGSAPSDICSSAPTMIATEGYCSNTGSFTQDIPAGMSFCNGGSIENNSYLKFSASEATETIDIWMENCEEPSGSVSGLQIQVLSTADCVNFVQVGDCYRPQHLVYHDQLNVSGLTIGQDYYLMIDGDGGDVCDFVVSRNSAVSLPVKLASFDAICNNGEVLLSWQTASEINNAYFSIEKSTDGIHYEELTRINGAGTTVTPQQYQFIDHSSQEAYYRLKQTDFNGKSEYFPTKHTECIKTDYSVVIYPNPANNYFIFSSQLFGNNSFELLLFDAIGKLVLSKNYDGELLEEEHKVNVSKLPSGVYHVIFKNNNYSISKKLILNK